MRIKASLSLLFLLLLWISFPWAGESSNFKNDILYYIVIDRFYDDDPDNNIPTYVASCKGIPLADALITLASVDPCYCCTERSLKVVDQNRDPYRIDLLKLSREKTQRIRSEYHV